MVQGVGESDFPLEKDILKKKLEFVKTWVEWAADNLDQIIRESASTGSADGNTDLFAVPANNTFFLTSLILSASSFGSGVAGNRAATSIVKVSGTDAIAGIYTDDGVAGGLGTIALSYSMPLEFQPGEIIRHVFHQHTGSVATISGFIVPKRIS